MKLVAAQEVIDNVKNELYSYFESGVIDESVLFNEILLCLGQFKLEEHPVITTCLSVDNYECELPIDYYKLISVWSCNDVIMEFKDPISGVTTFETRIEEIPRCRTVGEYYQDEYGLYMISNMFSIYKTQYQKATPLVVSTDSINCNQCINTIHNKYDISINKTNISTCFEKGIIYMEYFTKWEEKGELVIPDNELIKDWVKKHLLHFCFKRIFYNADSNVSNQLQYAEKELHIAKENARCLFKGNGFDKFVNLKNILNKEFKKQTRL